MGLFAWLQHRFYKPIHVASHERGLLLLNGRVARPLAPGLHRVWKRTDLRIEPRLWDTRQSVVTGIEPALERALPRDWYRVVDVAAGQYALVYHHGVPTAFLPPGHHLLWQLELAPEVRIFETESDSMPAVTPELRRLLPAEAYVAGTVAEDHVGLLFRDGVCLRILLPGPYGFWQQRSQLRVQLQNVKQQPFFPTEYGEILGDAAQRVDVAPQESVLIWYDGRPTHFLAQPGEYLLWRRARKLNLERFDVREPMPELSRPQKAVIPTTEYLDVRINAGEVGIVTSTREGSPPKALGPGRHSVWTRGEPLFVLRVPWLQSPLVAPEHFDIVPPEWTRDVEVAHHELAVVRYGGRPVAVLGEGSHRIWAPTALAAAEGPARVPARPLSIEVETIDSRTTQPDPRAAYFPLLAGRHVSALVHEGQVGILRRAGKFERLLEPGEHLFWNLEENASVQVVEVRPQMLQVSSQEMLTQDKVSLRLNLAVVYRIVDPRLVVERVKDVPELLYLKLQLATRRYVSSRDLDTLLAERDALEESLRQLLGEQLHGTGLVVEEVGLKDLILPGSMRAILNQVVEAQRRAEAHNIQRREETAATRSLANTARVLANNPVLLRLKELEHVKEIAERIGQVNLLVSSKEIGTLMGLPGFGQPMAQLGAAPPLAGADGGDERPADEE
jgi:hypothetical protein